MDENQQLQQENNLPQPNDNYIEGEPPHTPVAEPIATPPPPVEKTTQPEPVTPIQEIKAEANNAVAEVKKEVEKVEDKIEKTDDSGGILAFIIGGFFAAALGINISK